MSFISAGSAAAVAGYCLYGAIGVERCDTCLFNPEVSSKIKYVDVAKSPERLFRCGR